MSGVDLTIKVRLHGGFSRAVDFVNEVRAMLEREGWDPDQTMHYEVDDVTRDGSTPTCLCVHGPGFDWWKCPVHPTPFSGRTD